MSDKMSDKMSDNLSDKEKRFIDMMFEQLKENEYITTAIMAKASGMPMSTVRRYITKLCEMDIIYSEGKNKGTKYYIRQFSTNKNSIQIKKRPLDFSSGLVYNQLRKHIGHEFRLPSVKKWL